MHAFFSSYLSHQLRIIGPQVSGCRTVLDFGCGDMALDRALIRQYPTVSITGVDVVPFHTPHHLRLKFRLYKGDTLPFPARSFDAVFSYHVFHHTENPSASLKECARVSRRRIIIVEPVLRYPWEKIGFAFLDYMTNFWKKEHVPMPCHVETLSFWKQKFQQLGLRLTTVRHVGLLPRFLPVGETMLFVLEKRV